MTQETTALRFDGADNYVATDDLKLAVNAALKLQRPLLIKGEPGTGKTMLAEEVAAALNMPLMQWHIKSTTKAQQGLYEYDAVSRLRDSQLGDERVKDIHNYIVKGVLWQAFTSDEPVVLLIDEIDKADIEFPNDLLRELDRMEFYVYETREMVRAKHRPLVIITSNNEKELPDAFLRRCFFHYIKFPDKDTMQKIVDVHFPKLKADLLAQALQTLGDCEKVRNVVIYKRTGGAINVVEGRDIWMHDLVANQSDVCEPEWVSAEHPLFILYTSGSTGKPKGVQHSSGGYLLWAILTMKWTFDIKPADVFWCTADIGWVTGHTYITYGPLAVGATEIVFEGVPTFPNAGRFWNMIEKHKATIFYTAPTAIRSLIKAADADANVHPSKYDLSSLRLLGSVGEPINPEAWMWYYNNIGRGNCPIVDTFWQTETGGHMMTPLPGATPLVPGSCTLPLPGIMAAIVDETGHDLPNGQGGILVVKRPWPSMIRTIWGDEERFKKSYFPEEFGGKVYLAGDGAIRNKDTGYFTITGRIDDVLNVSGHRMGTMEIESALVANPLVAEAAVVGKPDDTTGEAICAFVVLKRSRPTGDEAKQIATELRNWVAKEIGPIAKPKEIRFGDNLPKTRSGKIMRRLLRVLAKGETITQDISTLENPAILEQLKQPL